MIVRLCTIFFLGLFATPLLAQDEPVHMRPEFALIFPLAKNGDDVTVKYPILINPTCVLTPGMVLRTLYVFSSANADGSSDLVLAHKGDMEEAYSRAAPSTDGQSRMPPELAHELEGYRRTIWEVPNNFVLAMAQYPTDAMHLIYSPTGKNKDIDDERFSFFDGLLVGLPNGHVTIIAVEKESKSEEAGLKAGDEILAVGNIPVQDNLRTFASAYASTKKTALDNEAMSYPVTIRPQGQGDPQVVNIKMPPTLKGGLMQGL